MRKNWKNWKDFWDKESGREIAGLLGIQGTGGFYIREGISLKPLKYGGTGRNSQQLTYENGDYEYEVGTQNIPGITGLLAGTEYILQTGLD